MLEERGVRISMSRTGNPWDNATCESFLKTLKYEEVYRSEYRDLADAYARIGEFLEVVYNQQRLHSALVLLLAGCIRAVAAVVADARGGACMSFLRHGEIYPCAKGTISRPCPRPSRSMSFQLAIPGGLLSSVGPWVHGQNAEGTQRHNEAAGTGVTGRVCSGAHVRARSSSVAPGDVIRTVVTLAAERQARDPDWESPYAHGSDLVPAKSTRS